MTYARPALAIVFGLVCLFSLWSWRRARPGSPDAFYGRNMLLLGTAFLLTLVPPMVWPADSGMVLFVASLAIIPFAMVVIAFVRGRPNPGRSDPPA